jgi:hypothetical protein
MEPLLIVLIPGVFGGLLLALLLAGNFWKRSTTVVPRRLAAPSPALINMARIPVEGVGGLGMVAAVITVAATDPRIRVATIVAAILGGGLALLLIAMRKHNGSLPSGADGTDDGSTLHLDAERRHEYLEGAKRAVKRTAFFLPRYRPVA